MNSQNRALFAQPLLPSPICADHVQAEQHDAPHLLLEKCGQLFSIHDLFGQHYVLLLGAEGEGWRAPALCAANKLDIELVVRRIDGDYRDVGGDWATVYGVSASGAVLVLPAGEIAWRAPMLVANPEPVVARALTRVLG